MSLASGHTLFINCRISHISFELLKNVNNEIIDIIMRSVRVIWAIFVLAGQHGIFILEERTTRIFLCSMEVIKSYGLVTIWWWVMTRISFLAELFLYKLLDAGISIGIHKVGSRMKTKFYCTILSWSRVFPTLTNRKLLVLRVISVWAYYYW